MKASLSPAASAIANALSKLVAVSTPSTFVRKSGLRETTTVRRPGSARPIDSHVRRPMIIVWPIVSCLNRRKSSDKRQGSVPPRPMMPFSATATMIEIRIAGLADQTAIGAGMCGWG